MDYDRIQEYVTSLVPTRHPEVQAMEAYARENGFPIVGPAAGYLCYQTARMTGTKTVFEMGSGYGYSTAWFAKAVRENGGGKVHHVVWDEDLSQKARLHLDKLGYDGLIEYHVAEAVETLDKTPGPFDMIFMDIQKGAYDTALPVIAEKLRVGGVLLVDNMLWGGRVFDPQNRSDSTESIRRLTRMLTGDPGWITTLAPVRDGVMVAYKV